MYDDEEPGGFGMGFGILGTPQAGPPELDFNGILKMFHAGPTPAERKKAKDYAIGRMGLGILAANKSGPVLQIGRPSLLNMVGQGGLHGMDAYQGMLNQGMAERKAGGVAALQAMQIKTALEQQALKAKTAMAQEEAFRNFARDQEAPAPAAPAAPAGHTLAGMSPSTSASVFGTPDFATNDIAPQSAPDARRVPNFNPLLAAGIEPARVQAMMKAWEMQNPQPDVIQVDAGNTIRLIDKKTLKVVGEMPKGAAPGAVPYEASDIGAPAYRDFLQRPRPGSVPFEASDIEPDAYRKFLLANRKAGAQSVIVQPDSLGLKPKDRFDMEGKLRDDFRANPTVKAADEMQSAFTLIKAAYERPSAANDLAMATKYMKILDPTSVVRESEFALAVNATGLLDKVQNYAASVLEGKKLNPTQREDFYKSAQAINASFQSERDKIAGRFDENAQQYNLSPSNVIGSPRAQEPKAADKIPATEDWITRAMRKNMVSRDVAVREGRKLGKVPDGYE